MIITIIGHRSFTENNIKQFMVYSGVEQRIAQKYKNNGWFPQIS